MPPRSPVRAALPVVLAVLAGVALVWSGVGGAGYVWDDQGLVLRNTLLDAPTWEGVFGSDLWRYTDGERTPYYRPLMTISLLVDRALGAGTAGAAGAAHLHSLAWHLGCVGLLYALVASRVGRGRAAIAALVAGLHPVTSEAVTWVAARNDLLAAAAVLGAFLALERGWLLVMGLAALAALLAKESAVLLLPAALVWAWGRRVSVSPVGVAAALLAALGVWLALRGAADLAAPADLLPDPNRTPARLALQGVRALGWLAVPWPLSGTANLTSPFTPLVGVGAAAAVVGLALLARFGGREGRGWLGVALLTVLPAGFALWTYGTLGERYLYLPVLALSGALAVALPADLDALPPRGRARAVWVGVAVGGLLAAAAIRVRVADWKDDVALFTAAAERAPDSYSWYLLGATMRGEGREAEALELFERSLAAEPHTPHACRQVADVARRVLDADRFVAALPRWSSAGCRDSTGFDGPVATQLLAWQRVAEARAWVAGNTVDDPSGRLEIARIVLALDDGDLLGAAALELATDRPLDEVRERAAFLRLAGPPASPPGGGPAR